MSVIPRAGPGETKQRVETRRDDAVDRLLALRLEARKAKEFAKADAICNLMTEAGVVLEDTPSGPRWSITKK